MKSTSEAEALAAVEHARSLCRRHVADMKGRRDRGEPHTMPPAIVRRCAGLDGDESGNWPDYVPTWMREAFEHGVCDSGLVVLREVAPGHLFGLVTGGTLPAHLLSFAAEYVGGTNLRPPEIAAALLPLLDHASPVVREGALYGLGRFGDWPSDWNGVEAIAATVRARVERVAKEDASETIREIAAGMLRDP